jgi:hypothetical protein
VPASILAGFSEKSVVACNHDGVLENEDEKKDW